MIQPPADPSIVDSLGNWIVFGAGLWWAIKRRGKQNETFACDVGEKVGSSVETKVSQLGSSLKTTQDLLGINNDKLKDANAAIGELSKRLDAVEKVMPELRQLLPELKQAVELMPKMLDTAQKFQNFFEAAKAGKVTAVPGAEEPPVTGKVTFKEEKRKS